MTSVVAGQETAKIPEHHSKQKRPSDIPWRSSNYRMPVETTQFIIELLRNSKIAPEVLMPNPHLQKISPSQLPPFMQEAHAKSIKIHGEGDRIEIFGNAPHVYRFYLKNFYEELFYGGVVDIPTKELLRLRLAGIHGCAHCNRADRAASLDAGISAEKVDSIMNRDATCFNDRERAILDLADQISLPNMHGELTKELYRRLREYYDDGGIYELGVVAAVLTGMAKMLFVYDLVDREPNCPIVPASAVE